ncbi:hypothetical protein R1sor_003261 [Riccia sorocarpa]|uniref:Uncharacterized protein n=1 Tax=Riccia sorocarpa TaxID=122646 RepID=A0ABD3H4Z8_9MARC
MAGMLRCLPFVESREDEDVERNKMAIVAARAFLDNRQGDAELRTQDKVSSEQEKMSESTDHAHEAGVSVPPGTKDSKNSKRFSGGVTLWFSLLLASVGHAVFEYVSGVVEKMEKLDSGWLIPSSEYPPRGWGKKAVEVKSGFAVWSQPGSAWTMKHFERDAKQRELMDEDILATRRADEGLRTMEP